MIQFTLDQLLDKVTLHDLVNTETESAKYLTELLAVSSAGMTPEMSK
jgi:hypothetical protein